MALRVSPTFPARSVEVSPFMPRVAGNATLRGFRQRHGLQVRAKQSLELESKPLNEVIFEPFSEVQSQFLKISSSKQESLARQRYSAACEAAINEQINVEYNVSYIYHALFAYFDRDNVALPGLATYFKESSDEERRHAETFIKYQNLRGGRVTLQSIIPPEMEFDHSAKGDALYAMELALSLERLTNDKLLNLAKIAQENDDPQLSDFVDDFLAEQVQEIREVSEYVSQLRRVGEGHGVYHFDLKLQKESNEAAA